MIGRQVHFVFDEVDAECFMEEVQSSLDGVLLEWRSPTETPVQILEYGDGKFSFLSFFCRRDYLSQLKQRFVPKQGYWVMDALFMPVVSWSSCRSSEQVISEGRLYYTPGMYVGEEWEEKGAEFLEFARKLFVLVKKRAPLVTLDGRRVRLGKHTAEMIASGQLRFMR